MTKLPLLVYEKPYHYSRNAECGMAFLLIVQRNGNRGNNVEQTDKILIHVIKIAFDCILFTVKMCEYHYFSVISHAGINRYVP